MKPNKVKILALALLTLTASIASAKDVDQTCKDLLGKIGKNLAGTSRPPDPLPPLAVVEPRPPGLSGPYRLIYKPVSYSDGVHLCGRYRFRSQGSGI
jgi:hypothetical protein